MTEGKCEETKNCLYVEREVCLDLGENTAEMCKHSVVISGHYTSVSLENIFWRELKNIAIREGQTVNQIISKIDNSRTGNLSSAIRVFVLLSTKEHCN